LVLWQVILSKIQINTFFIPKKYLFVKYLELFDLLRWKDRLKLKTWALLPMYATRHNTSTHRFGQCGCPFMEKHNDPYPITGSRPADHLGLGRMPIPALEHSGKGRHRPAGARRLDDQPLGGKA
jgi:hypothetical protein